MKKLKNLKVKTITSDAQLRALKGGGVGNFDRKEGKKCPPPWEDGSSGNQ